MPVGNLRNILLDHAIDLKPVLRLRFAAELASGIASIHNLCPTRRLTHGDLKPENVLLSKDLHCKVADFGSAKLISYTGSTSTSSLSLEAQQLTLVYAAPERLYPRPIRPRKEQDTYSYGVILHGVLSREIPHQYFAGEKQYLDAVKHGERPDCESIADFKVGLACSDEKRLVETLESVMKRCWAHDAQQRPDMLSVRDELMPEIRKYNQAEILRCVATAADSLRIRHPSASEVPCLPLNTFDTRSGKFSPGRLVFMCTALLKQYSASSKRNKAVLGTRLNDQDYILVYIFVKSLGLTEVEEARLQKATRRFVWESNLLNAKKHTRFDLKTQWIYESHSTARR